MNLEVKNLVFAGVGATDSFKVELYNEKLDEEVSAERIHGDIKVTRLEEEVLADFDIKVKVQIICDRCLEKYEIELPIIFKQVYQLEQDIEAENPVVDKNFSIDVFDPIRQEIIAALPIKKLCQTDCKGICPGCGVNLNIKKCECSQKSTRLPNGQEGKSQN